PGTGPFAGPSRPARPRRGHRAGPDRPRAGRATGRSEQDVNRVGKIGARKRTATRGRAARPEMSCPTRRRGRSMYVRESLSDIPGVPGLLMDNTTRRRSSRVRKSDPIPAPATRLRYRWAAAVRHLRRVDPHMRAIIDRVGPCRLEPKLDRFGTLVRAIIGQ